MFFCCYGVVFFRNRLSVAKYGEMLVENEATGVPVLKKISTCGMIFGV
jgi:hypothetical protein